jgi:hypothetical protein
MGDGEPAERPKGPEAAKPGLIERLAERSTGLPGNEPAASEANRRKQPGEVSLWKLGGLGLQFGGSVVVFLLIGRWIDSHYGWKFGATLTMIALALIGNFYLLIKETMKMDK